MSVLLQWSNSMITCSAERPLPILTSIIKKPLHRALSFKESVCRNTSWKSDMRVGTECFWFHSPERIFPRVYKLSRNVKQLMWRTDSVWNGEGWVFSNLAVIQLGLMIITVFQHERRNVRSSFLLLKFSREWDFDSSPQSVQKAVKEAENILCQMCQMLFVLSLTTPALEIQISPF